MNPWDDLPLAGAPVAVKQPWDDLPLADDSTPPKQPWDDLPLAPTMSAPRHYAAALGQGAAQAPWKAIRGAIRMGEAQRRLMGRIPGMKTVDDLLPDSWKDFSDLLVQESEATAARRIRDSEEAVFKTDPARDKGLATQVVKGIGGFVPTAVASIATGGSVIPAAVLGALTNADSAADDAAAHGATEGQRDIATLAGGALGLTEAAGMGRIPSRAVQAVAKKFEVSAGRRLVKEGFEEMAQNAGQQLGGNIVAKDVAGYDEERGYREGVGTAAAVGALAGAAVSGAVDIGVKGIQAAQPTLSTPDLAETRARQQFGEGNVKRVAPHIIQTTAPDGRTRLTVFRAPGADLDANANPTTWLESVAQEKGGRPAVESARRAAQGRRIDLTAAEVDAAAMADLKAQGYRASGLTTRGADMPQIVDPATGNALKADVAVELVSGQATAGTMAEEDFHSVLRLAGVTDAETAQFGGEEALARELDRGADHPILSKVRNFVLSTVNQFRGKGETLFDAATRIRGEAMGRLKDGRPATQKQGSDLSTPKGITAEQRADLSAKLKADVARRWGPESVQSLEPAGQEIPIVGTSAPSAVPSLGRVEGKNLQSLDILAQNLQAGQPAAATSSGAATAAPITPTAVETGRPASSDAGPVRPLAESGEVSTPGPAPAIQSMPRIAPERRTDVNFRADMKRRGIEGELRGLLAELRQVDPASAGKQPVKTESASGMGEITGWANAGRVYPEGMDKETTHVLDKFLKGKKLTVRQNGILETAYDYVVDRIARDIPKVAIPAADLQVGDKLKIDADPHKVIARDAAGNVTLKDGQVIQVRADAAVDVDPDSPKLEAETTFDVGEMESARPTEMLRKLVDLESQQTELAPPPAVLEFVTSDELAAEQARMSQRAEIRKRQEERLTAPPIDTTGDLFSRDAADNPLFAPPAPGESRAQVRKLKPHVEEHLRRQALRVASAEEWEPIADAVQNHPVSVLTKQSWAGQRERIVGLSMEQLLSEIATKSQNPSAFEGDDNDLAMLNIERFHRLYADPATRDESVRVAVENARNATMLAQMLAQQRLLYSANPEAMVALADVSIREKSGKPLSEAQRHALDEQARKTVADQERADQAQADYTASPTMQNARRVDDARTAADHAALAWTRMVAEFSPKSWSDILKQLMQAGALTTSSIAQNVVGNMVNAPLRLMARNIAAPVEMLMRKAGWVPERTLGMTTDSDVWAFVEGAKSTLKTEAMPILLRGESKLRPAGEALGFHPYLAARKLASGMEKLSLNDQAKFVAEATLGVPAEAVFRMLQITDAPFYGGAKRAALNELGRLRHSLKTDAELERFALTASKEERGLAELIAKDAIYQGDSTISRLASYLQNAGESKDSTAIGRLARVLAWRPIILFAKTPANVAYEAFKFLAPPVSAVEFVSKLHRSNALRAAKKPWRAHKMQRDAFLAFGRMITGAALWAAVDFLAKLGIFVGSMKGDDFTKERELAQSTLKPLHYNHSALKRVLKRISSGERVAPVDIAIQPGDVQKSYHQLGIMGLAMNMAATGQDQMRREAWKAERPFAPSDVTFGQKLIRYGVMNMPSAMLDYSMMKGTASALQAFSDGEPEKFLEQMFRTWGNVPAPNLLKQAARMRYEWMPDTRARAEAMEGEARIGAGIDSAMNDLRFKMALFNPRLAESMPIKRDIMGRPIRNIPEGANRTMFNWLSTTRQEPIPWNDYASEVRRVYMATGNGAVIPSINSEVAWISGVKRRLNEWERNRLKDLTGGFLQTGAGWLMSHPNYATMTDIEKARWMQVISTNARRNGRETMLMELNGK